MVALGDVLRETQATLTAGDIPDARLEAELLLTDLLSIPRHRLYAFQEDDVPEQQQALLAESMKRRLTREPLAYILGHKGFYGIDLTVDPGALIPRPESEYLVEQALLISLTRAEEEGDWVIAEPGAGSGALSVSLAIHLPMARIYATENSPKAVVVAATNIQRHNVADRITLIQCSLLDDLPEKANIIVANLPYIRTDMLKELQMEVRWEPQEALDGGADGLDIIRDLLSQAPDKIRDDGILLLEINPDQAAPLKELARSQFPDALISVEQDLAHLDRYLIIDLSASP